MEVRLARRLDMTWIPDTLKRHKRELGFVANSTLRSAIAERRVLVLNNQLGFCHYRPRKDGWFVIYEIVSETPGGGRMLLEATPRPVRLKCPVDLPANAFYAHMGMQLLGTEKGKKRALNVWFLQQHPNSSTALPGGEDTQTLL